MSSSSNQPQTRPNQRKHAEPLQDVQQRQQQQQQQQQREQELFNQYVGDYLVELQWPPTIMSLKEHNDGNASWSSSTRTSHELIYHRLLEAGVLLEVPTPLRDVTTTLNEFIQNVQETTNNCFHSIKVELDSTHKDDPSSSSSSSKIPFTIRLHEKNWYTLHVGGSLVNTQDMMTLSPSTAVGPLGWSLPTAEFNMSAGLRNLTGACDATHASYTLDTNQMSSATLSHERPLYAALPSNSVLQNSILLMPTGSQYSIATRAFWKHVDYQAIRAASYQEYQRGALVQIANTNQNRPGQVFCALTYQALLRDIIPHRQMLTAVEGAPANTSSSTNSMFMNASVPIVQQAGPTLKHSILAQIRQNGSSLLENAHLPTQGIDWNVETEYALPVYSDVSFLKVQGNASYHVPLWGGLALHGLIKGGYLHDLSTMENRRQKTTTTMLTPIRTKPLQPPTVSDRFYLGGPMNFRGFLPAGIGPRAKKQQQQHQPRDRPTATDAMGGDFYYTATAMASIPIGGGGSNNTSSGGSSENDPTEAPFLDNFPLRAFVFGTVGTCVGSLRSAAAGGDLFSIYTAQTLWQASRASVGVGLATNVLGNNRLELTYAIPIRYGPMDHRRNFQVGMALHVE